MWVCESTRCFASFATAFSSESFNQVYDVDNKTYLVKMHQPDKKVVLLIESGTR